MSGQMKLELPVRGIVPPLLTPLVGRDELDAAGFERLIEHVIEGGVHGLFFLGTTGEGPSLGYRLRREVIERGCGIARGRVPVFVGITDTAFVESVTVARQAAESGASAVVVAPPYYLPEGQPELREYLTHLIDAVELPIFIYNMPPITKVPIELDTVRWAMDQPRILGIKDSSADLNYFNHLCVLAAARPDWTVLVGPEEVLAQALLMGGHGGVNGGANVFPKLYVKLFEAAQRGDYPRARDLQRRVLEVSDRLYRIGRHPSSFIKGLKCAASCMGLCSDFMAEPFHRFREAERRRVAAALEEIQGWARELT